MSPPSPRGRRMRRFWDDRAREDAFYFVDSRLNYGDPDLDEFWKGGEQGVQATLEATGTRVGPGDVVVEIGSGVGRLTRALAARAREVIAVEISSQMIELAEEHNPDLDNVRWMLGDGESLAGIDDGSVDGCFSLVVFQHIPDAEIVLGYVREMGRILRPGGWTSFQISNDPSIHRPGPLRRAGAVLASRLGRGPSGRGDPAWLGTAVSLERLRDAAESSGLEIEKVAGEGTQYCLVGARRAGTRQSG